MCCSICKSKDVKVIYHGVLKTGLLSGWTDKEYDVYQCNDCHTIWNTASNDFNFEKFYESSDYREKIEKDISVDAYCKKYDSEVLDKLNMTGTAIFRNKICADIGCGGGSFIDFISGVSSETIAIEPSKIYRKGLAEKNHKTYAYASDAIDDFAGKVDVVTSFDVIEHVKNPENFLLDVYNLLIEGGKCVIGTPTDYPVLRKMLGDTFNKFIFQVQHPWVLSDKAMKLMAERIGFKNIKIEYKQKYGLGNLLSWLLDSTPRGDIKYDFISPSIDAAYKKSMSKENLAEYIILYAEK